MLPFTYWLRNLCRIDIFCMTFYVFGFVRTVRLERHGKLKRKRKSGFHFQFPRTVRNGLFFLIIRLFGSSEENRRKPNLAIIAQNRLRASPKNGISFEGITIFLEKISAKTRNPELLRSIPGGCKADSSCYLYHSFAQVFLLSSSIPNPSKFGISF
jgi:hypothetical protein